jgi:hypothetical protein
MQDVSRYSRLMSRGFAVAAAPVYPIEDTGFT